MPKGVTWIRERGVPVFSEELDRVVARYGIEVHNSSELVEVDPDGRRATIADHAASTKDTIDFDMLHLVPPQSAPDWLQSTPLADPANPAGYVEIDKHTMRHVRYPNIRKQAPVVAQNVATSLKGSADLPASYNGYSSCPITTGRHNMLLAEFDYEGTPRPSFPVIDTTHERRDMWYLKRYGLPYMYWNRDAPDLGGCP
jgi:sulfide:quinone oxidoreductase